MNRFKIWKWGFFVGLSKNKSFEFEIIKQTDDWLNFSVTVNRVGDHAGVLLQLGIIGGLLLINFYDNRHWNYDANRWYLPGEEIEEAYKNGDITYEQYEKYKNPLKAENDGNFRYNI